MWTAVSNAVAEVTIVNPGAVIVVNLVRDTLDDNAAADMCGVVTSALASDAADMCGVVTSALASDRTWTVKADIGKSGKGDGRRNLVKLTNPSVP